MLPDGAAWVADDTGVLILGGASGIKQIVGGPRARDLAVAPDGSLWIISFDGLSTHVFRHATGWEPEYYLGDMEAASIAVDENGFPWFVGAADGQLYSW